MSMMQQTNKEIIIKTVNTVIPILAKLAPHDPNLTVNQSQNISSLPVLPASSSLNPTSFITVRVKLPPFYSF